MSEPTPSGDTPAGRLPSLRDGTLADLEDLWRLYNGIIAEGLFTGHLDPLPLSDRRRWLEEHLDPRYPLVVAHDTRGLLGYGSLSPWRSGRRAMEGTVEASLYLAPSARGSGLGRILLTEIVSRARSLGHEKVIAVVFDTNAASLSLLDSFGFQRWGHLPDTVRTPKGRWGNVILGYDLLATHP